MSAVDLLLRGGLVVDGSGAPGRPADVAVAAGRVLAVGALDGLAARREVDVTGQVVCPGFVDLHSHSDLTLLSSPAAHSKVRQGVTTEVVGNCGLGVAPLADGLDLAALRGAVSYLDLDPAVAWRWRDLAGYRDALAAARPSVNVATLVGHLPLRAGTVGFADRPASAAELDRICGLLADAFGAGAAGLSTGLVYAPACYAGDDELLALGRVAAAHDRVFAWHLRDYADGLLDSVRQALRVAERSGCRTQLSHLAAVGRRNWGGVARALELVSAAHGRGVDVAVDGYPYLAGNASLSQLMPAWAQDGGGAALLGRLRRPAVRARIRAELGDAPVGWDEIYVDGRSVAALAAEQDRAGADVVMDLLQATGNSATMVAFGRSEDDLRALLGHPLSVIGSDGFALDPAGPTGGGVPHPRSYGCYPRVLARYAGAGGVPLPEAVAKCTARPAARIGLTDRGSIAPGRAADLLVFDPARITDRATFHAPQRYPDGIRLVVVNGTTVVDNGRHTGAGPGLVLAPGLRE